MQSFFTINSPFPHRIRFVERAQTPAGDDAYTGRKPSARGWERRYRHSDPGDPSARGNAGKAGRGLHKPAAGCAYCTRGRQRKGMRKLTGKTVRRGDIYYADLSPVVGSEQGGVRPVLIVQNDVGNRYSPTVIAAAITSRLSKNPMPTHIDVRAERADRVGLTKDSVILLEQMRTIDKKRLGEKMGHLDEETMTAVDNAISVSLGLGGVRGE